MLVSGEEILHVRRFSQEWPWLIVNVRDAKYAVLMQENVVQNFIAIK